MSSPTRKKQVAIVIGTRPEIIKMAPVIEACKKQRVPFFIIHSNQHYSKELDSIFFEELSVPKPRYNLGIGSGTHGDQTGRMCSAIEAVLLKEQPRAVLVHGDTNTALAGALAAVKLHIPIVHVEAGLRSGDRKMPEEINRIMIDHISDLLCAPTKEARSNLLREGIPASRIVTTGSTIIDSIVHFRSRARARNMHARLGVSREGYFLATLHRPETTDTKEVLVAVFRALGVIAKQYAVPILIPLHPRTEKALARFKITVDPAIHLLPPLGYLDFLNLQENARLVLTDSGGIQEEAYLMHIPCVTIRTTTERPETFVGGGNVLAGVTFESVVRTINRQMKQKPRWKHVFGKPGSSGRVVEYIKKRYYSV